jgi:hypothetical protein
MPKREQFFKDIQGENRQVALLMAQVGAMPNEVQLVVQVADYLEEHKGLKPLRAYVIRVLGATEHRVSNLGTTSNHVEFTTDHPLLYQYITRPSALFFRGQPKDAHELVLDIAQAHAMTFKGWRHFPEYLNLAQPLVKLVQEGGLLGQMPEPLALSLEKVLQAHGLETKLIQEEAPKPDAKSPLAQQHLTALLIGESYFLSYAFSFEEMGKV